MLFQNTRINSTQLKYAVTITIAVEKSHQEWAFATKTVCSDYSLTMKYSISDTIANV